MVVSDLENLRAFSRSASLEIDIYRFIVKLF
jgi:hypothetical protein